MCWGMRPMTPIERFKRSPAPLAADVGAIDSTRELEYADDGALLSLARQGSEPAIAALFVRYRQSAEHYARYLGMKSDAPDVVSETFAQIIDLIRRGKGPEKAFRAYLLTSVRHECGRRAKARLKVVTTGETDDLDQVVEFGNGELNVFERGVVRDAYASLPERWRAVLWELDVEGRTPQEVAERQGMKSNAVSALAYRARAGLRESYLQQHVGRGTDSLCEPTRASMAAVVRGTAKQRDRDRVLLHMDGCDRCVNDFNELTAFNGELGAAALPAVVAVAGAGAAGWWSGAFGWFSAAKGTVAAAVVPVAAVGALAVAPSFVDHDPMVSVGDSAMSRLETDQLPDMVKEMLASKTARQVAHLLAPSPSNALTSQGVAGNGEPTGLVSSVDRLVSVVLEPIRAQVQPVIEVATQSVGGVLGGVQHFVNEALKEQSVSGSNGALADSSSTSSHSPTKGSAMPEIKVNGTQVLGSRHEGKVSDSSK